MTPYYQDDYATLYCGDCREILPRLPKADLILTDPPYGVGVKYGENYNDDRDAYWGWFLPTLGLLRLRAQTVVFTHANHSLKRITDYDWVGAWNKGAAGGCRIGNSCLIPTWEPIFLFGIHRYGTASDGFPDVFNARPNIGRVKTKTIGREKWETEYDYHPCPKPEGLYSQLVRCFGQSSDIIIDPFCGSGTTLVTAKQQGRRAIGIEVEQSYCEITANRLRNETNPLIVEEAKPLIEALPI